MIASMARLRRKQENGESGFTLIELLVVVVIIGILVAIAVPLYLNYRKGANDKAAQSDVRGAVSAIEQCSADASGTYPTATSDAPTGCTLSKSDGTTLVYKQTGSGSGYRITGTNSKGKPMYYCFDNTAGSIKSQTSAFGTGDTC